MEGTRAKQLFGLLDRENARLDRPESVAGLNGGLVENGKMMEGRGEDSR
jgi:hypothetical protein